MMKANTNLTQVFRLRKVPTSRRTSLCCLPHKDQLLGHSSARPQVPPRASQGKPHVAPHWRPELLGLGCH